MQDHPLGLSKGVRGNLRSGDSEIPVPQNQRKDREERRKQKQMVS